ncbi:response regulator [Enterococcus casseliflavus]|uniref:response regulator n=1 Tax=Enterococcus casseliflavus TaxID=37734 RepID=UPI00177BD534|nr:response regulator transcription factor [Enterococcus casseliflavus]QOG29396.1 response regulator transcription factor [Enterococcus casseliflavus]
MKPTKVLLVDDHTIVREGLKLIFEAEEEWLAIDEAKDGKEALASLSAIQYDLILLDIQMPVMGGVEFLEEKRKLGSDVPVIILTMSDDIAVIRKTIEYGVKSYIMKDSSRKEMLQVIKNTLENKAYFPKEISELLNNKQDGKNISECSTRPDLTQREMLILTQVVRGSMSKEIAIDMGITERTVKAHLTNIYRKIGASSRAEAVSIALVKKIIIVSTM